MTRIQDRKIKSARITDMPKSLFDKMPEVWVLLEGSTQEIKLFEFYPDEISFSPSEFIGLTVQQATNLKFRKDHKYLTT